MNALLTAIVTWLSVNFGLPASYDHPAVELAPAAQIAEMRYGAGNALGGREVLATYDDAKRTVFLARSWTGRTPAELSILVHEMVHHLQNVGGLTYPCPAAREKLAYDAQGSWLALFGEDLLTAFALDPITLKVTTHCMGA